MQAMSSSQPCLLSSHEFPCSNTKSMCRAAQQKGNETKGQSYRPCQLNVDQKCSKPHDKHFCWRLTSKHSTSYTPFPHITSMLFDQRFHFSQGLPFSFSACPTQEIQPWTWVSPHLSAFRLCVFRKIRPVTHHCIMREPGASDLDS